MKKILLIIVVLLGILVPSKIYALEDSFYEGEYIPNAYIKKFKGDSGKYEQMRVFRRKSDNRVVYCLQLWEKMHSDKNMVGYDNNQSNVLNIDSKTWNRIMLIAYYGYGYNNDNINHDDIKWYAVSQFMIWQTLENNSIIFFTDTLNGNKVDKFTKEIVEINELVKRHDMNPSFVDKFKANYYTSHYLTDYNTSDSIKKFEIIPGDGLKIKTILDNNIEFLLTKQVDSKITLIKSDKLYTNNPTVYIDNNYQNLLLPGSFPSHKINVDIILKKGNVVINNLNCNSESNNIQSDVALSNIEIEIYDYKFNHLYTKKANENNQIFLNNIGYGKYMYKISNLGKGYILNDDYNAFEISSDNSIINICHELIKNKIIINKYSKDLDNHVEKEEAEFDIYNSKNKKIYSFITENGYYEMNLPYGRYKVKQVNGKENYKYVDDFEIKVEENNQIQEFNLYDEQILKEEVGNIIVEKSIDDPEIIFDIPNTYTRKGMIDIFDILFIFEIFIIRKGILNEKNN